MEVKVSENGTEKIVQAKENQQKAQIKPIDVEEISRIMHSTAILDISKVPTLVGDGPKKRFEQLYNVLTNTKMILYLRGDSGTGKTATGQALLKKYSQEYNVPAYYFQLSQEDTKTTVLMGPRIFNGTTVTIDGVLAQAAREHAIVFIDEITQSTTQMLLMLNSIDGAMGRITTGDRSVDASNIKLILGSNKSHYTGNIRIPPALASRIIGWPFEHPTIDEEARISKVIALREFTPEGQSMSAETIKKLNPPDSLYRYLASYANESRKLSSLLPLSARNVAHAVLLCHLAPKRNVRTIDRYFMGGTNIESIRRATTRRILGKEISDVSEMQRPEIQEFMMYVTSIGLDEFKQYVKIAFGLYIDIDGLEYGFDSVRQSMMTSII